MKYVSTKELGPRAADLVANAQQEPVTIRDEERDVAVLLSAEDYQKLIRREAVEELKQLCVRVGSRAAASGLTDKKLSELLGEDN